MLNHYRPLLGFLYALLFVSFVGISLGQSVGGWISTNYGGWVTLEAVTGYGFYLAGLIWLINRVNKAMGFVPPSTSKPLSPMMTEMQFIRSQKASEYANERPADLSAESENGPKV